MPDRVLYQQINKDHAYWIEKRAVGQLRGGNTSGLLTHFRDEQAVASLLFDAGLGTIEGLADLRDFSWRWPLEIFITHGHFDHHAELQTLAMLWCRRMTPHRRGPIQIHATGLGDDPAGTFNHLYAAHGRVFENEMLAPVRVIPGMSVRVGLFTVHAIAVDHFPGAAIYVVEFGKDQRQKIIIGWDMKTLPDVQAHPVLKNPSLALLEANSWTPMSDRTGHTSVQEIVETGFVQSLEVECQTPGHHGVALVHCSGKEDPWGIQTNDERRTRFRKTWPHLAGVVDFAERGQQWWFDLE